MTQYKPTLIVKRLIVTKGKTHVFDEKFHKGLNIIRGQNGSGKTTIIELIAFALGKELKKWKPEALSCDFVFLEVSINDYSFTLKRELENKKQRPLEICDKPLEVALSQGQDQWTRYPFNGTSEKESFSQSLFNLMGMPQTKGSSSKLTMNQILRFCYAEQSTPASAIFTLEQFDSALTREAIFNLLMGLFNDDLYNAQLEADAVEKSFQKVSDQLTAIYRVLGQAGFTDLSASSFSDELNQLSTKELAVISEISTISKQERTDQPSNAKDLQIQKKYDFLEELRGKLVLDYEKRDGLTLSMEDSQLFIEDLKSRQNALNDSQETRNHLSMFQFDFCPACLSPITLADADNHICVLCKTQIQEETARSNLLKMANELKFQIMESEKILQRKRSKLNDLKLTIQLLQKTVREKESELELYKSVYFTPADDRLKSLYELLGTVRESIESLQRRKDLFRIIEELRTEKGNLNTRLLALREQVETEGALLEKRQTAIKNSVFDNLKDLLQADLDRQEDFSDPEIIDFSPANNSVFVNGKDSFAESSMVYLNNAFHLAVLKSSCEEPFMRYPRFLMLDGIENGGMEEARSRNLQLTISKMSAGLDALHQIIVTTANIDTDLENDEYTIGRYYTREQKSLNILGRQKP